MKHQRRPLLDQRGVSLLEVMISMVVFLIGVAGLMRMQIAAAASSGYAGRLDRGTAVANDLMAYLQALPYDHALLTPKGTVTRDDLTDESDFFVQTENLVAGTDYTFDDSDLDGYDAGHSGGGTPTFAGYFHTLDKNVACPDGRPDLDFNGDKLADMDRYWIVENLDADPSGRRPGKIISVIVRWPEPATGLHRRVVLVQTRFNPSVYLPGS